MGAGSVLRCLLPSNSRLCTITTARAKGTQVTPAVVKDLLVAANRCAGQHDPDAPPGEPRALSHRASEVVCSRRMLPRPTRAPAAQSARATHMLTVGEQQKNILAPVTPARELQLVSMSVGPRYSRAVLVK